MNLQKVLLILSTFYISSIILDSHFLMVPNNSIEKVKCYPIEDGYEYNNIVVDVKGVSASSPSIECWYNCFANKCKLELEQPMTESWLARILISVMAGITMFVIFEL